jgi:hypothetical protein
MLMQHRKGTVDFVPQNSKHSRCSVFENTTAEVGDGPLYLQLNVTYLTCRTVLYYSPIM